MHLDRYKVHNIDLVVDRLVVNDGVRERLMKSLQEAMRQGKQVQVLGSDVQRVQVLALILVHTLDLAVKDRSQGAMTWPVAFCR